MVRLVAGSVVVLALVLSGPAEARAEWFSGPEHVAYDIAAAYWGRAPNCYGLTVKEAVPEERLQSFYRVDANLWGYALGGRGTSCSIFVLKGLPFDELCATMVHEMGHLFGYRHSTDPTNPMYPVIQVGLVPGCVSGIDPGPPPPRRLHRKRHRLKR